MREAERGGLWRSSSLDPDSRISAIIAIVAFSSASNTDPYILQPLLYHIGSTIQSFRRFFFIYFRILYVDFYQQVVTIVLKPEPAFDPAEVLPCSTVIVGLPFSQPTIPDSPKSCFSICHPTHQTFLHLLPHWRAVLFSTILILPNPPNLSTPSAGYFIGLRR